MVPGWGTGEREQVGIRGLPGSIVPHAHFVPTPGCAPGQANHLLSFFFLKHCTYWTETGIERACVHKQAEGEADSLAEQRA